MKVFKHIILASAIGLFTLAANAEHLVMVTTDDTHSQIAPDFDGKGGILRRLAVIDSIKATAPNFMLIDAGDVVQGTLYFTFFKGEVEFSLLDRLGYDIGIMGNHEFDNGVNSLAENYGKLQHTHIISTNYDLTGSPLESIVKPYEIRRFGDQRVGFIGINIDPVGMVAKGNYDNVRYMDAMKIADATAKYLKEVQGVDRVVMISHVGYISERPNDPSDLDIIKNSHYIDLVIGGHTHLLIDPNEKNPEYPHIVKNADGREIVVTQLGKSAKYVGHIDLDITTGEVKYNLIKIDKSLDSRAHYPELEEWLKPYSAKVDEVMNRRVATADIDLSNDKTNELGNWVSDAVMNITENLTGYRSDFCILNKGGLRTNMPKGDVSEGLLNSIFPFNNRLMVLEISGENILKALEVMAHRDGDVVSKELDVEYDAAGNILSAKANGLEIKSEQMYRLTTIDFLANGGDYLVSLMGAKRIFTDDVKYGDRIIDYVKGLDAKGEHITTETNLRMHRK